MKIKISGTTWNAQPWDGPGTWSEHEDIDALLKAAKCVKSGKGFYKIVECDAEQARYLAKYIADLGGAWLYDGNPENRNEATAMLKTSAKILAQLENPQ